MGNTFIPNPELSKIEIIDAINERLMKSRSLTSFLVTSDFLGEISKETLFGYALALDGYLEEVDYLLMQLDKKSEKEVG
jgi:hypothetical protein